VLESSAWWLSVAVQLLLSAWVVALAAGWWRLWRVLSDIERTLADADEAFRGGAGGDERTALSPRIDTPPVGPPKEHQVD
jgi:hypothetical protein